MGEIRFYNRSTQREEVERVYGGGLVHFLYGSGVSKTLLGRLVTSKFPSQVLGRYQESPLSARGIEKFAKDYGIDLGEFEPGPFSNFNSFFVRKFRDGARPIEKKPDVMPAFCEARYFGYGAVDENVKVPVKGQNLSAEVLLGKSKWASVFAGGPGLLARLCPVDYHRFHFPDDCKVLDQYEIPGTYHSVNPLALKAHPDVFIRNERQVAILESEHFGKLAMIEVGAFGVGKIVQTYSAESEKHARGDEKGLFLFGGSTVLLLGERGRWKPSPDLLEWTAKGKEVLVRLGEALAQI